jgi:DNA-binding response OmpR family regulator
VEAGFDAHLVKPIDIDTLLNALDAGRRGTGSPPAS